MGTTRAMFGWYDSFIEKNTSKLNIDSLLVKLQGALPQYEVYTEGISFRKAICVKQSSTCGLLIYKKKYGLALVFDAPNTVIRLLKKMGMLWILLYELRVKKSQPAKVLMSDVQAALGQL